MLNNKHLSVTRKGRFYWLKLKRLRGDPFALARGLALGCFVGITPTIPLHTVLILVLAAIFRAHLVAAMIFSIIVSNPLTVPIFYYISWLVGYKVTGAAVGWAQVENLIRTFKEVGLIDSLSILCQTGADLIFTLLVGGFIVAVPPAIATYYASLYISYKKDKKKAKSYLDYALWRRPNIGK